MTRPRRRQYEHGILYVGLEFVEMGPHGPAISLSSVAAVTFGDAECRGAPLFMCCIKKKVDLCAVHPAAQHPPPLGRARRRSSAAPASHSMSPGALPIAQLIATYSIVAPRPAYVEILGRAHLATQQVSPYFDPTYTRTGWIGQPPVLDRHEVVLLLLHLAPHWAPRCPRRRAPTPAADLYIKALWRP